MAVHGWSDPGRMNGADQRVAPLAERSSQRPADETARAGDKNLHPTLVSAYRRHHESSGHDMLSANDAENSMISWREAAKRGAISGTWAALASGLALMLSAKLERRRVLSPLNAPSQWIWGQTEGYETRPTWKHTALGYGIHHASAVMWATLHEKMFVRSPLTNASREIARAGVTTAI